MVPTGIAWGTLGAYEPDTQEDATLGYMWPAPDISASLNKVYFNGFFGQCYDNVCSGVNPNVATLQTGVHTAEYEEFAVLGVWKDCNNDGYMGLEDQGLIEYRSEVLNNWPGVGASICPVHPGPTKTPQGYYNVGGATSESMPTHNDGTWVHEYIPIQWYDEESLTFDHNPMNIDDQGARVWMDHGAPGAYEIGCYYTSWPVGTFRSTGGMLHTFDCIDSHRMTDTIDSIATGPLAPLSFADAPRDQSSSGSTLNQKNPWGDERSDGAYVEAWDCGKKPLVGGQVTPVTAGPVTEDNVGFSGSSQTGVGTVSYSDTDEYNVSAPAVPPATHVVAPSAGSGHDIIDEHGYSMAGTMNATGSGLDECVRNAPDNSHNHNGQALGAEAYRLESGTFESAARTSPDDTMAPQERNRPAVPFGVAEGTWGPTGNFGLWWLPGDCHDTGVCDLDGVWEGGRVWHQETVFTGANGVRPVMKSTYYAFVSPAAVAQYHLYLPKSPGPSLAPATGRYGQEACGGFTSGVHNNWQCDSTLWYLDARGKDQSPRTHYLGPDPALAQPCAEYGNNFDNNAGCKSYAARPGQLYDMLDIDCYDQSISGAREQGVGWGALTSSTCDRP